MTTRWWAPAGPALEPDQFDLGLLVCGEDPAYDLGAALMALHRTGAAACEAAAAKPLPDAHSLVETLSVARLAVADSAVDVVSKSVGHGPYAGLLVADVLNDAEEGAVALFQAAVSKGVAPLVACQRAGMVYGVPTEAMGDYHRQASDPRAVPATLVALADQTLWSFVEKVVQEETLSLVSKAREDNPDTKWWDKTDDSGQFAPRGGPLKSKRAAPSLAEEVKAKPSLAEDIGVAEPAAKPAARPTRQVRQVRQTRQVRQVRPEGQQRLVTQPQTVVPGTRVAPSRVRTSKPIKQTRKQSQRVQQQLRSQAARARAAGVTAPKYNEPDDEYRDYYIEMETPLAVTIDAVQYESLREEMMLGKEGKFIVFASDMLQRTGAEVEEAGSTYANQSTKSAAQNITEHLNWSPAQAAVSLIPKATIGDPVRLQEAKVKLLTQVFMEQEEADGNDPELSRQRIEEAADRATTMITEMNVEGDPTMMALVFDSDGDETPPHVVRFTFEPGVRGYADGTLKHPQYYLDPKQLLEIDMESTTSYDRGAGVVIVDQTIRPAIRPVDDEDDVVKAQEDDPSTTWWDKQGSDGRFVRRGALKETGRVKSKSLAEEIGVQEPTPVQSRLVRQTRKTRPVRATRLSREQAAAPVSQKLASQQRKPAQRVSARRVAQTPQQRLVQAFERTQAPPKPGVPEFRADQQYVVLSGKAFRSMLEQGGMSSKEASERYALEDSHTLGKGSVESLFTNPPIPGDVVESALGFEVDTAVHDIEGEDAFTRPLFTDDFGNPVAQQVDLEDDEQLLSFVSRIHQLMDKNPALVGVAVNTVGDNMFEVFGNLKPIEALVVIEHGEEVDVDKPVELSFQGTHRIRSGFDDELRWAVGDAGSQYQANIRYYKIINPSYRVYGATQAIPPAPEGR